MFHRVKVSSSKVRGAGFRLRSGRRRFHPELQGTLRTISETQFSVTLTSRMEGQASPRMYPTAESPSLGYPEGVWGWFIRIFHTFAIFHSELQGGPGSCRPTSGAFPGLDMVGVTPPGAGSHTLAFLHPELIFSAFPASGPPTDRSATVTRHRRAPAGQPRAGVRADGSSGLRVRLHGR